MDGITIYENKNNWFIICKYVKYNRNILDAPKLTMFYNKNTEKISKIKIYLCDDVGDIQKYKEMFDDVNKNFDIFSEKFKDNLTYVSKSIIEDRNLKLQKPPKDFIQKDIKSIPRIIYMTILYINDTFSDDKYSNITNGNIALQGVNNGEEIYFIIYKSNLPNEINEKLKNIYVEYKKELKKNNTPWYKECILM